MTFSTESQYLIYLISCAIKNIQPEEKSEHLSFEKVYEIGVAHEVANIAFYGVEKLLRKPDSELYRKWENRKNISISRDFNQAFARSEIIYLFQKYNIKSIEIQGTEVKKLYPRADFRTMSDIDLIIEIENLEKAKEILEELGYKCTVIDGIEVDGFRSPNICVEIHTDYFSKESEYYGILPSPFEVDDNIADVFYAYNMLHIAKHYYGRGCGIRRVLDVYFLNKAYGKTINKEYVYFLFEKAKIVEFVNKVSDLADCWFGGKEMPEDLKDMERYILYSGVHGKEEILMENHLKKNFGKEKRFLKTKYFLRRLFPNKTEMCKKYPRLKKCIFLYPFFWIHRTLSTAFNSKKRKIVLEDAKNVIVSTPDRKI